MAQPAQEKPPRAIFREHPTAEALAFDRRMFGIRRDGSAARPVAFGIFFDCHPPICFLDYEGKLCKGALLDGGIAVLRVLGPLEHHESWAWNSYAALQREMEIALAYPGVNALVLKFDTPGGVCSGMLACHREIKRLRAKFGKPVVGWVDELAASAGYGLVSACDEIWIPPEGEVGSIGVILCTVDETDRLKKEGISVKYVVTGKRKSDLHPGTQVTDEVLAVAQAKVDELGGMFFETVAQARGTTSAAVQSLEAAVFRGKHAVSAGLADGVADWQEFLGTLRRSVGANVVSTSAAPIAA
jgi:capsid assembly protease